MQRCNYFLTQCIRSQVRSFNNGSGYLSSFEHKLPATNKQQPTTTNNNNNNASQGSSLPFVCVEGERKYRARTNTV